MTRVHFTYAGGAEVAADGKDGQSMMQLARKNDVEGIEAECGGEMSCGTCHVYVDEAWFSKLPTPGEHERELLEVMEEPRETSRLSCQIRLNPELDGIRVVVPDV